MASRVAAVVLGPWSLRRRCRWQRWAVWAWASLGVTVYCAVRIAPSRGNLVAQVILGRGLVLGIPVIHPLRAHRSLLSLLRNQLRLLSLAHHGIHLLCPGVGTGNRDPWGRT